MKEYSMLLPLDEENHDSQDLTIEGDTVEDQGEELPQKASVSFDEFFDLCDHCFGKDLPQYTETSMVELADMFVSGFVSFKNLETYKQLFEYGLSHVVGLLKLSKMGIHYGKNKLHYKDQVIVVDEYFFCLMLQDCWILWRRVASDRILHLLDYVKIKKNQV
eukprot:15355994-Ditylum_brightwellii.AAC.1